MRQTIHHNFPTPDLCCCTIKWKVIASYLSALCTAFLISLVRILCCSTSMQCFKSVDPQTEIADPEPRAQKCGFNADSDPRHWVIAKN